MERMIDVIETTIPKGRTLRIQDGKGLELEVVAGSLWVTQAGDPNDDVVEATGAYRVSRDGLTLVHAFEEARLQIANAASAGAPSVTLGAGYREVGATVFAAMVRGWVRAGQRWFDAAVTARAIRGDLPA
jgi:hypothetical protein